MKIPAALRYILLAFAAFSAFSCRTAPPPDPTAEYRRLLAEEIGSIGFGCLEKAAAGSGTAPGGETPHPGPEEQLYRETFGYDKLIRRTGAYHRMGMLSARPGPLGVQYFVPQGRPKGTVFIAHGYLDHAGPLRPLIAPLVEEGFSVVAFDLPGHGFSGGERGAIADFADYGTAAGRLVGLFLGTEDDLEVPAPGTEAAFPRPWTALGHSTGAAAFFIYLTNRASRGLASPFDAVLFINPLVRSARWRLSVTGLFLFGWAVRNYDPRHVPDPLLGINNFPVSWAERLRDWNARIKNVPPFRHTGRILQGLADEVVDYRYNVPFLLKKITGTDVLYLEGVDHVPYTDRPENRQVVEELLRYLRR